MIDVRKEMTLYVGDDQLEFLQERKNSKEILIGISGPHAHSHTKVLHIPRKTLIGFLQ